MPIPNDYTFTLSDVVNEISPTLNSLAGCFADAIDWLFDSRHKGDKDRLSNFKNYGWQGCFVYKDSEVISHPLVALHGVLGSNYYCFGAASNGYACGFQIDNNGTLYELGTIALNGDPVDIYAVSLNRIFVITKGYMLINRSVLYSLQFDGSSWTELDNIESVYGGISPSGYKYKKVTADPVNQFVFCSGEDDDIIDVYSWDSNGDLTLEYTNNMPEKITDITWMPDGYLAVSFEKGSTYSYMRSYSVNSSGVLSLISTNVGTSASGNIYAIENNGDDIIIYIQDDSTWDLAALMKMNADGTLVAGDEEIFYNAINTPPSYSPNTGVMVFLGTDRIYGRKIDNDYSVIRGTCYIDRNDVKLVYAGFNGAWAVVYTENGSTYTLHSYEIT